MFLVCPTLQLVLVLVDLVRPLHILVEQLKTCVAKPFIDIAGDLA